MKHFKTTKKRKTDNKSQKPKVIILLGPPGAGKGTQAELLAEKLGFYYLETSKLIEVKIMVAKRGDYVTIEGKKYSLTKERKLWKSGILCTPAVVTFLVNEKIKELAKRNKGIIMGGSPRTLYEAKKEVPILKKLYGKKNIKVILINISPKISILRNSHRRICQLMRHPILWTKETAKLKRCPLDGSKLIKRALDTPKIIKVRLKEYRERTFPLIEYLREEGFKIKKINGEKSVAEVYKSILKALK